MKNYPQSQHTIEENENPRPQIKGIRSHKIQILYFVILGLSERIFRLKNYNDVNWRRQLLDYRFVSLLHYLINLPNPQN